MFTLSLCCYVALPYITATRMSSCMYARENRGVQTSAIHVYVCYQQQISRDTRKKLLMLTLHLEQITSKAHGLLMAQLYPV
jgi:hypothetical protein